MAAAFLIGCGTRQPLPEEVAAETASRKELSWVKWYEPEEAASGFNLVLHYRRTPMIRDMNGRPVHSWPDVRATGRARLSRQGRLLVIATDHRVKEYDWSGELLRILPLAKEGDLPHHDLIELTNDNHLLLALEERDRGDYLLEVDGGGNAVWEWRAVDHIDSFPDWMLGDRDPTHMNSVRELPPNRWFDAGDERFRPGNILVSARNQSTVFVIDKSDGAIVWQYSDRLDHQHEAIMLGSEAGPRAGMILVFNNGRNDLYEYRTSRVILVDPIAREEVWEYRSENFFSSHTGVAQPLPNGNVLITSNGGRVFEVTSEGDLVWEWAPSYTPMRVQRLAWDHTSQLEALRPEREVPVTPPTYEPHVDWQLYQLDPPHRTRTRRIWGQPVEVLRWKDGCRQLRLPAHARMQLELGFNEQRLGKAPVSAAFGITLESSAGVETLLDVELSSDEEDGIWRRTRINLSEHSLETVEMCLTVLPTRGGKRAKRLALWGNPLIRSGRVPRPSALSAEEPISEEERELRRRQLEALGYVN